MQNEININSRTYIRVLAHFLGFISLMLLVAQSHASIITYTADGNNWRAPRQAYDFEFSLNTDNIVSEERLYGKWRTFSTIYQVNSVESAKVTLDGEDYDLTNLFGYGHLYNLTGRINFTNFWRWDTSGIPFGYLHQGSEFGGRVTANEEGTYGDFTYKIDVALGINVPGSTGSIGADTLLDVPVGDYKGFDSLVFPFGSMVWLNEFWVRDKNGNQLAGIDTPTSFFFANANSYNINISDSPSNAEPEPVEVEEPSTFAFLISVVLIMLARRNRA